MSGLFNQKYALAKPRAKLEGRCVDAVKGLGTWSITAGIGRRR